MKTLLDKTTRITPQHLIHAFINEPNTKNFMPLYLYMKADLKNLNLVCDYLPGLQNLSPIQHYAKNMILYNGFIQTITKEHSPVTKEQYVINQICNGSPTGKNSDIHWFLLGQLLSKTAHTDVLSLPKDWGIIKNPFYCYNQALWKNPSLVVAINEQRHFITNFIAKIHCFDADIKASELMNQTKSDFEALKHAIQNAKELYQLLSEIPKPANRLSFLTHLIGTTENIDKFRHAEKPVDTSFIRKVFKSRNELMYVLSTLPEGKTTIRPREVILKRLNLVMPTWIKDLPEGFKITPSDTQPIPPRDLVLNFFIPARPQPLVPAIDRMEIEEPSIEGGEIEDLIMLDPVIATVVPNTTPERAELNTENIKSSWKLRPAFFNKTTVNSSENELVSLKRARDTDEDEVQNQRPNKK